LVTVAPADFVKMVHNGIEYGDMQLISGKWLDCRQCSGSQRLSSCHLGWLQSAVNDVVMSCWPPGHCYQVSQIPD